MDAIKEPFPFVTKRKVAALLNHLVMSLRKITLYIIDKECLPQNNDLGFCCFFWWNLQKFIFFFLQKVLVLECILYKNLILWKYSNNCHRFGINFGCYEKVKKKSVKEFQINALWRSLIKWNEVYKFSPFHVKKCYRNIISMTKIEQFTENMASITNSYWFAETFCHVYMSA